MESVKMLLGVSFDDITIDENNGYLYFVGTALEEGVWSDSLGHTAFWPKDVIHAGMSGFVGKAITCQHDATVGKVLDVFKTELGFKAKGVITSKRVIELINNKTLRGLSVTTDAYVDPMRRIVDRLTNQTDIAVVTNPACRVCMLENTWNDNMKDKEIETVVESVAASEAPEIVEVKASAEIGDSHAHTLESVEETTQVVEAAELAIDESAKIEPIVVDDGKVEALNMRLSAYEAQIDEYKEQIIDKDIMIAQLSAEVSIVRAQNEELATKQRDELMSAIMSADPNADKAILEKLSTDALGAYVKTVMHLSAKKTVTVQPKGLKINEAPVAKETVATKNINTHYEFAQYVKNKSN